ncbi:ACT domain-containing protein [Lysinibacillus sp. 3P01SB]|uniref:ACT domain-containing protein n=1 Tax=Lysinibacillus sp. 3P01SB TaxID=3132284 RepID=UPI0039A5FAB5
MEKDLIVQGVSYEADIIRLTIGYDAYEESVVADIVTVLAENGIDIDMIVQVLMDDRTSTISFSMEKEAFAKALRLLESSKLSLGFSFADFEVGLAKVSLAGSAIGSNPRIKARMFTRLSREGIQVKMISSSEYKMSVVVSQGEMMRAANALHNEFHVGC